MKVVLGSLLTYQVIYWGWLKLESIEKDKEGEGMSHRLIRFASVNRFRKNHGTEKTNS
jgi:hypothetical protein